MCLRSFVSSCRLRSSGSAPEHIPFGLVGGRNCVVCAVIPICGDLLRYRCIRMGQASWRPLRTVVALYRLNLPSQIHTHTNNARSYGGRSVYRIACFNRPGSIGRRCRLVQKRQQPQKKQNHSISPIDYKERDYQLARFRAAKSQPLVIALLVPPIFHSGQGGGVLSPSFCAPDDSLGALTSTSTLARIFVRAASISRHVRDGRPAVLRAACVPWLLKHRRSVFCAAMTRL